MERMLVNILVLVRANPGENPGRRKHTVFLATLVSEELVGPKLGANHLPTKGNGVNILQPTA